jgi:hypothetical protein
MDQDDTMTKQTDFADGMFASDSGQAEIPRDENGTLRVMCVTAPCRSSAELEAREKRMQIADKDFAVEFLGEDGLPEVSPLSEKERAAFASHFTPEELEILETLTRG